MFAREYNLMKEMSNEKRRREIEEIISVNVEIFKYVLSPREFNTFRERNGNNLLQIAIVQGKKKAFNYILSLDNFPLNSVNFRSETALMTAFRNCHRRQKCYFPTKLINKGATLDSDTLLLSAIKNCHEETCLLLIEKGVDVNTCNSQGVAPLRCALKSGSDELIAALLCNGAFCDVSDFAYAVVHRRSKFIQDMLSDFVFDSYTESLEMGFCLLLELVTRKNLEAFERVIRHVDGIIMDCGLDFYDILGILDCETLTMLVTKYDFFLKMVLESFENPGIFTSNDVNLVKLDIVLGSSVGYDVIMYMQKNRTIITRDLVCLIDFKDNDITEIFCLLLSYGLEVRERYLDRVYRKYGFCDLFRFLLHMDHPFSSKLCGVASLFYNVSSDLNKFLQCSDVYVDEMDHFLEHSAHPHLQELCNYDNVEATVGTNLPKIPLLVELARNSVRKFIVNSFDIKNFRELNSVLSKLPICKLHRKIITLEEKLY